MILQQDNHDKIKIEISPECLEMELQEITKWRKNHVQRFKNSGSIEYDQIIKKLSQMGYKI